ncbi:MAG: ABC transporter ATP-binding protein [Chloroflexales bacterium]|nr:ABC transporter ATP-binding protein [Chloroflexales bacterium]
MLLFRRMLSLLKPHWLLFAGAWLSLILSTGANLVSPMILRSVLDDGISARSWAPILSGTVLLVGLAIVRGLFGFTQSYWSEKVSQSFAYDLRNKLFEKIQTLSFAYHDRTQAGQLMTRLTSDVEQVRSFVASALLQFISALLLLIGSLFALFSMNWQLTLIAIAFIPPSIVVLGYFMQVVRPMFSVIQERLGLLNVVLQENISGARLVKAFGREAHEEVRFAVKNESLLEMNLKSVKAMASSFPIIFLINNLGTLGILWAGGYKTMSGEITIGELIAFTTYLSLLFQPLFMLGMISAQITRASVSNERIFELLDTKQDVEDSPNAIPMPAVQGHVRFDNVTLRYAGSANKVLDDVTFDIAAGTTVAILGTTGSGKSSLINLIPRFYETTSGAIVIDGHDVRTVKIDSLRSQIGIVLQETTLFSGTIRDNIAYGRPDASDADVLEAAQRAQADSFIQELPQGYVTVVGEKGVGLSGGQRQRIAIARALLLNPKILILDDSTSAVDAETEFKIQQALDSLMHNRTSFVIAQRISTVRNANVILLLDGGKIIGQGSHDDLLRDNAVYGEIIDSQFGHQLTREGVI